MRPDWSKRRKQKFEFLLVMDGLDSLKSNESLFIASLVKNSHMIKL